jgi:uncharacterized protein DUF6924
VTRGVRSAPGVCGPLVPSELWSVDNNLNIANMDWEDFADTLDLSGIFRGFNL